MPDIGQIHRVTCQGDRNGCPQLNAIGVVSGQCQWQESVVGNLSHKKTIVAYLFQFTGPAHHGVG